jgi:hypothetical protein
VDIIGKGRAVLFVATQIPTYEEAACAIVVVRIRVSSIFIF